MTLLLLPHAVPLLQCIHPASIHRIVFHDFFQPLHSLSGTDCYTVGPPGVRDLTDNLLLHGLVSTNHTSRQEPAPAWGFHSLLQDRLLHHSFTMGCRGTSALLVEHLLPFFLLSPGCHRAISLRFPSLLTAMQLCFPRGVSTTALSALRWVGWSQLEPSVSDLGQPWALLTEATPVPTTANAWTPAPRTLCQWKCPTHTSG